MEKENSVSSTPRGCRPLLPLLALLLVPAAQGESSARLLEQARTYAQQLVQQTRDEMSREMTVRGPLRALMVCRYSAPEIASQISRSTGARVVRVSLAPRNVALGSADPWEQRVLLDFERRLAAGERPEKLEFSEIVSEPQGGYFRYLKGIPVAEICLACHGGPAQVSPAVRAQLATDYPHDQAAGKEIGQLRGGVSVKILLPARSPGG